MVVYWTHFPSLYKMAIDTLIDWKHFNASYLDGIPGVIKEDILRLALVRGKVENVSCFLHSKIRELCISETVISTKDLESLCNSPEIRILEMNPPPLQQFNHPPHALMKLFCCLSRLFRLNIQRNNGMTDEVMLSLTCHCTALQEIDVTGCISLTDHSADCLSNLPALRAVNLSQTQVTDRGLKAFAEGNCSDTLSELILNSCVRISDKGLKQLYKSKTLRTLACSGCPNVSGREIISDLGTSRMILTRLCCQLGPEQLGLCLHFGNSIVKTRSGSFCLENDSDCGPRQKTQVTWTIPF